MNDSFSGDIVVMETSMGTIELKMFSAEAPKTVENFIGLAKKGYYNGITFHRVLAFDAQTLQLKWTVPLIGLAYGEGAAAMASDFVTLCDGHLHAYQLSSGNGGLFELANLPCDNRPIVAGGKIIYHDPDRHAMTALGLGNGR